MKKNNLALAALCLISLLGCRESEAPINQSPRSVADVLSEAESIVLVFPENVIPGEALGAVAIPMQDYRMAMVKAFNNSTVVGEVDLLMQFYMIVLTNKGPTVLTATWEGEWRSDGGTTTYQLPKGSLRPLVSVAVARLGEGAGTDDEFCRKIIGHGMH